MKILLINASPHENGATSRVLSEAETALSAETERETVWLGKGPILSCTACGFCKRNGRCFWERDLVNEIAEKCRYADGFIFGTPVHYAGVSGALKTFLGRLFYSSGGALRGKPAMAVSVARRAGGIEALDEIYKFLLFGEMPIISGSYWCSVYGKDRASVEVDIEGLQAVRVAARNLEYLTKCTVFAREGGLVAPEAEEKVKTGFLS